MLIAAAVTVVVVIVVRFVWVFSAMYLPVLLRTRRASQAPPSWQSTFMVGFTGIRGVVSLVAALSIPQLIENVPFPDRDLILFVTFVVILVSLIGQGTALPSVIKWLGLDRLGAREAEAAKSLEVAARVAGIEAALQRLKELEDAGAVSRSVANLRRLHEDRRIDFIETDDKTIAGQPAADAAWVQLQLIEAERVSIAAQFAAGKLSDEARRRVERELDLEDARVRSAADSATPQGFREI
jgi:CPA1 family monovalent cation:H+ antiporter